LPVEGREDPANLRGGVEGVGTDGGGQENRFLAGQEDEFGSRPKEGRFYADVERLGRHLGGFPPPEEIPAAHREEEGREEQQGTAAAVSFDPAMRI